MIYDPETMGFDDCLLVTWRMVFDPVRHIVTCGRRLVVIIGWHVYEGHVESSVAGSVTELAVLPIPELKRWPRWRAIPFVLYNRIRHGDA